MANDTDWRVSTTSVRNAPSKTIFLQDSFLRKPFALALLSLETPAPVAMDN